MELLEPNMPKGYPVPFNVAFSSMNEAEILASKEKPDCFFVVHLRHDCIRALRVFRQI